MKNDEQLFIDVFIIVLTFDSLLSQTYLQCFFIVLGVKFGTDFKTFLQV